MINTESILKKIEEQIQKSDIKQSFSKQGEIIEIKDGVVLAVGLDDVMFSEIVEFENGSKGLVLDLLNDQVGILMLGDGKGLTQGQIVKSTGQVFSVSVGEAMLGRVVNALGEPVDGLGPIKSKEKYPVERIAPGVITRKSVDQPLQTGLKIIDALVPIGRGQRELIIGDRQTGKTAIALDTIINQKNQNMYCVYVAIGQKESKIKRFVQTLREKGALDYSIIISAPINNPSVMQYLAPYVGCAMGERFMNNGKDAVIFYDDLSKHAVAYREISLLLRRPPGREAYPGDVFYLHSRLLERAARVTPEYGGGSLTALPIIETQAGDIGAYIPTNVISITDGQIFLDSELFNSGNRPAMDVGLSVSRVGGAAQTKIMKKIAGPLKLELANYAELAAFAQFSSDLDADTLKVIENGKRMTEILKQPDNHPIPFEKQAIILYIATRGYFTDFEVEQISDIQNTIFDKLNSTHKELAEEIRNEKALTDTIETKINQLAKEVTDNMKDK
ncbi:MAG TPA: F0F1 ATP synthase subunit alpha [Candidatus Absconditabacterales bacterium]|nr:F0F1 ATP synthase subunit alpha [Candidatus Absconditabacterales bacterium]